MRTPTLVLAAAWLLGAAAPGWTQKQAALTPADLLPADTLGYVEVTRPGALARELRDLFKGSVLYNLPDSMAELEAKYPRWSASSFKMLGLVFAPEVVGEVGKVQGAAAAFLGL